MGGFPEDKRFQETRALSWLMRRGGRKLVRGARRGQRPRGLPLRTAETSPRPGKDRKGLKSPGEWACYPERCPQLPPARGLLSLGRQREPQLKARLRPLLD